MELYIHVYTIHGYIVPVDVIREVQLFSSRVCQIYTEIIIYKNREIMEKEIYWR